MESNFEVIENPRSSDAYVRMFQRERVSDEELSSAMIDSLLNSRYDALHQLITCPTPGRRVFKQLCIFGKVPFLVNLDLQARQEVDLAFNVVVGKCMWTDVMELYRHADVMRRSRGQALRRAIKQGAWETVTKMAVSDVTPTRDRRHAFLSAVRQEELHWAVHMCDNGVTVFHTDLKFAIKTCFATGQGYLSCKFLHFCEGDAGQRSVFRSFLKEAIRAGCTIRAGGVQMTNSSPFSGAGNNMGLDMTGGQASSDSAFERVELFFPEQSANTEFNYTDSWMTSNGNAAEALGHGYGLVLSGREHTATESNSALTDSVCFAFTLPTSRLNTNAATEATPCLLRYMIRQVVEAGNEEFFECLCLQVFQWQADGEVRLRYAFRKAINCERYDLVTKTISGASWYRERCMLHLAVTLGMKSGKWEFVRQVVEGHENRYFWMDFFVRGNKCLQIRRYWPFLIPIIEPLVAKHSVGVQYQYPVMFEFIRQIKFRTRERLAAWCEQNSYRVLALCLALQKKAWTKVKRMLDAMSSPVDMDVLKLVLNRSVAGKAWDLVVECLKKTPVDKTDCDSRMVLDDVDFMTLIQRCRSEGMTNWIVKLAVWTQRWDTVEAEMESCHDVTMLDFVLAKAPVFDQWQIVIKLLDKCTGGESCLPGVLTWAVSAGECACAKKLMNMIDPLSRCTDILSDAVRSNNEEMVRLCIQAGLSTHDQAVNSHCSVLEEAMGSFGDRKLSVVKALFVSGASSHAELEGLKSGPYLKWSPKKKGKGEIIQYIEAAASTPRSLQSLCRLSVSHLIGCQPVREDRVRSLPVPQSMQDYILFMDLASTDEQDSGSV